MSRLDFADGLRAVLVTIGYFNTLQLFIDIILITLSLCRYYYFIRFPLNIISFLISIVFHNKRQQFFTEDYKKLLTFISLFDKKMYENRIVHTMSMDTILKFLKENLPLSMFIGLIFGFIISLLIYITCQVTNHIPTQINELKQNINENRKLIIDNQKETNSRFDKLYELLLKRK